MTSKVYAKILIDNISSLLNSDGEDSADSYEEEVQVHKIYLIIQIIKSKSNFNQN